MALPHKNMKIVNFWDFYHIQLKGIETSGTKNDVLELALQLLFLVNCDRRTLPKVIEQKPQKRYFS